MSNWSDAVLYIKTQLKPGVLGNTNVQKILNSILAVIGQINAGSIDSESSSLWDPLVSYSEDIQPVLWQDNWLVSNVAGNLGNVPISTSGVLHPSWRIIGSSPGSGIRPWQAIVYPNSLEIIFQGGQLYFLNREIVGLDPFVSVDFGVELSEEKWVSLMSTPNHNDLTGLNVGDYKHLTAEELATAQGITRSVDGLGDPIQYQFPTTVKGSPATEEDEFVTKSQLPVISQYGLLNGGTILWTTVGFNFQWSPAVVAIGGECTAPSAEIPLTAAHATLNRVDLLGWLKTAPGVAVPYVVMGTPAPTFNPPPFDPTTFVVGIPVQIPFAATTPSGISTEVIYAENTGAPEWVPSSTGTGTSNPADTANPKSGTYAVKASLVENGFKQIFTRATPLDITTYTTLGLDASLIASLGAGQGWLVGFLDSSGNPASNSISIQIDKSLTIYQFLALNLNQFTFTNTSIQGIVFTYVKTKGPAVHAGIYFDNIKLQGGVDQPETPGGTNGTNGWSPVFAVVSDGDRRVLQVTDWIGGTGTEPASGQYVGSTGLEALIANGIDIRGTAGGAGGTGLNGWSPVFAVVADGARRVLQVSDWVGGTGTKPAIGLYVGATGFEALIANGVDIRGAEGAPGSGGGGGHVIKTVGTPLTQRAGLNFSNQFIVTDDAVEAESKVEINTSVIATVALVNSVENIGNVGSKLYLFYNY